MAVPLTPGTNQPWLTYGVKDPSVLWLTSQLAAAGVNIPVTDTYDWTVAEAIASIQRDRGYYATGETDDYTWSLVNSVLTGAPVEPYSGGAPVSSPAAAGGGAAATPAPAPAAPATTLAPPPVVGQPPPQQQPTLTNAQNDALARLNVILNQYGLGSLVDWVRTKLVEGASEAQIQVELYDQPAFKQRFPAIEARRTAGMSALNPTEILAYEQQVAQLVHTAGLPAGFGAYNYAQSLLSHDVSIAELSERIEQGFSKVAQAPPEVRGAFNRYFGIQGDNALAALFLDGDKALPELEKMAMSAFVGGIGSRYGVNLSLSKAREIADTGLSEAAVWQGYRQLDTLSPLFAETLGETTDLTKEGVGVDAVFGTQAGAEATLENRRASRVNSFGGQPGGGAYATSKGAVGLGVADG